MIDLNIMHFFLSLQVLFLSNGLFIPQSKCVLDLFKCFKMDDYKACVTPFPSSVKLAKDCESSKVDTTLYHWLFDSLIYLIHR